MLDIDVTQYSVIAFDLDDTLHEFKKASSAAAEAVFSFIEEEFGTEIIYLRRQYREILDEAQSHHFVENKSAREYRHGRFEKLLQRNSILPGLHIDAILDLYDEVLADNLRPKVGAYDVLKAAKDAGKAVVVISEGPQDAQELTIQRLGYEQFVDLVITSSSHGVGKTNGLLEAAVREIGCTPQDVIYVGDNVDRDYVPADNLGMHALLLDEDDEGSDQHGTSEGGETPIETINSLIELRDAIAQPPRFQAQINIPEV